jgi:hypothetical protein
MLQLLVRRPEEESRLLLTKWPNLMISTAMSELVKFRAYRLACEKHGEVPIWVNGSGPPLKAVHFLPPFCVRMIPLFTYSLSSLATMPSGNQQSESFVPLVFWPACRAFSFSASVSSFIGRPDMLPRFVSAPMHISGIIPAARMLPCLPDRVFPQPVRRPAMRGDLL